MTENEFIEQSKELILKFAEISTQFWKDNPEYSGRMSGQEDGEWRDGTSILITELCCSFQNGEPALMTIEAGGYDSKRLKVNCFPMKSGIVEFEESIKDHREKIEEEE